MHADNVQFMDKLGENFPSPTRVWMGPNLYVFIHDAENAEQVLKGRTTLNKANVYEAISDVLGGDGLFTSSGNVRLFFVEKKKVSI